MTLTPGMPFVLDGHLYELQRVEGPFAHVDMPPHPEAAGDPHPGRKPDNADARKAWVGREKARQAEQRRKYPVREIKCLAAEVQSGDRATLMAAGREQAFDLVRHKKAAQTFADAAVERLDGQLQASVTYAYLPGRLIVRPPNRRAAITLAPPAQEG